MTRKVAGAVVVLVAGLACTACGSSSARTTTTAARAPRTVTVQLPVTQQLSKVSGSGSKKFRPFAFHGQLSLTVSCKGKGTLNLDVVASDSFPGLSSPCPEAGAGLGPGPGSDNAAHRAQFSIAAPSRVHWTLTARETTSRALTAPAKVQRLPISRSGVGPALLGTFRVRGGLGLYVKAACVGTGKFGVSWGGSSTSTLCPNSWDKTAVDAGEFDDPQPQRVRIEVLAPAGMKWTITALEVPTPTHHSGANVG
jgi:hypothetical protein